MTANENTETYNQVNDIILPNKDITKRVTDRDPSISTEMTSGTNTDSSTNNLPTSDDLNFQTGMSNFCLKAYLSNEQLQQARESIRADMNTGKSVKEQLKESTRLSAGIIFKAGSSRLGKMVFDIHKENVEEKQRVLVEKIKKEERIYNENVKRAEEIFRMKPTLESMTIRELTLICKPLKRKGDGKMPNKKESLILKYKEWSGRPAPSFDVSHLVLESDCGDNASNTGNCDDVEINSSHNDDLPINEIALV